MSIFTKGKNRVLAIGLDGATFSIIKPLIRNGKLKFFDFLMRNGFSAVLKSTIPPVTAPAWASFATGKNPGKHGVFSFLVFDNPYNVKVVNSYSIKSITLWRLLSFFNKKVCIMNVPLTYPPHKVNGILVPGMLTPPGKLVTYPRDIAELLKKYHYTVDIYNMALPDAQFFEKSISMLRTRLNVALKFIREKEWDLFLIIFVASDRIQHRFWHDKKKIHQIYKEIEDAIKKLISASDEEYITIIFSDHGFTDVKKKVKINLWLARKGYLKIGKKTISKTLTGWPKAIKKRNLLIETIKECFSDMISVLDELGININKVLQKIWPRPIHLYYSIDWKNSFAYFTHHEAYGIHIVKKENTTQYRKLRDKLIEDLLKLKDPLTSEPVFQNVYKREEIYWGRYVNNAPDIILRPLRYEAIFDTNILNLHEDYIEPYSGGFHDENGIFIVFGNGICSKMSTKPITIFDIAPTILHILNVPIPLDMDGRILFELFKDTHPLKSQKPKFITSKEILARRIRMKR